MVVYDLQLDESELFKLLAGMKINMTLDVVVNDGTTNPHFKATDPVKVKITKK